MDSTIIEYINATFPKVQTLRKSEKGEVWLAADTTGKPVIVKRIFLTGLPYKILKENPQSLCPKILYCAEDENETLVVEEYAQGESLLLRLEEGQYLTEKEAEHILYQLCDGLHSLHQNGIIHRDIKPSNLILQDGGIIRLIDFDAARTIKEGQSEDTRFLGTKGYAPPEQFGYGQTDARSDIYSVGVTMQKMVGNEYSGYLNEIFAKCTEIDPKKRYSSVRELKQAILWGSKSKKGKLFAIPLMFLVGIIIFYTINFLQAGENSTITEQNKESVEEMQIRQEEQKPPPISENTKNLPKNDSSVENEQIENTDKKTPVEETSPTVIILSRQDEPVPVPAQNSGIETNFSVNGAVIDSASMKEIALDRERWGECYANLDVTNKTNEIWNNPSIRIVFRDNWGKKHTETKSLSPIAPGESSAFSLPVGSYPISNRPQVSAWLQVYLDTNNLPSNESYWCVQFQIKREESTTQDDSSKQ